MLWPLALCVKRVLLVKCVIKQLALCHLLWDHTHHSYVLDMSVARRRMWHPTLTRLHIGCPLSPRSWHTKNCTVREACVMSLLKWLWWLRDFSVLNLFVWLCGPFRISCWRLKASLTQELCGSEAKRHGPPHHLPPATPITHWHSTH